MTARLIDGRAIAKKIEGNLKIKVDNLVSNRQRPPFLAVILVGDDPASQVYVGHKEKACARVGIQTKTFTFPKSAPLEEVLALIERLNADSEVDAILPQLPMPEHIDRVKVIHSIDPSKDVDGLGPVNQGLLQWDLPGLYPCTPQAVLEILRHEGVDLRGTLVAVLGRSLLVGAPILDLLGHAGSTLISIDVDTKQPESLTKLADAIIVATGVKHLVKAHWVKPGAVVIDVGIHRDGNRLTGDVAADEVKDVASALTPVPGGVGPMTIAMLLSNCLRAYVLRLGLDPSAKTALERSASSAILHSKSSQL